jgi:uncharacterized protein (DUF488 family)
MLLTYGHGTETAGRTAAVLAGPEVASLVDIRIAPGSRRNPQFARGALEEWLPEAGIAYRWEKRLGGFRQPSPGNPDTAWHEDMYRGYAEYMRSPDFRAAIDAVLAEAEAQQVTVMCSESLWWRCHRRLLADFVAVARPYRSPPPVAWPPAARRRPSHLRRRPGHPALIPRPSPER